MPWKPLPQRHALRSRIGAAEDLLICTSADTLGPIRRNEFDDARGPPCKILDIKNPPSEHGSRWHLENSVSKRRLLL
jgi:hypothetical protein